MGRCLSCFSLIFYVIVAPSHSGLNLPPQSSVQAAISGHSVTMATLGHAAAGGPSVGRHSVSLSLFPLSLQYEHGVVLFFPSLCSREPGEDYFTLFPNFSPLMWPSCTLLSPCLFVSSMCHAVCLSLSVMTWSAVWWWRVGSLAFHVECVVAKHIQHACRHI